MKHYAISERHACRLIPIARSSQRYRPHPRADEAALRQRLRELAAAGPSCGYRQLRDQLRREGQRVNHKRVYRLYREECLMLRRKHRKRLRRGPQPSQAPTARNQRWSMDFLSDAIAGRRPFRVFTLLDDYTRECLAIEVDTSLSSERVKRVLGRVIAERGRPRAVLSDNGPEFRSRAMAAWSAEEKVRHEFIEPGKPVQNAFVESFHGRMREECLNLQWFVSLADARRKIEAWRQHDNHQRGHSSLGYQTPAEFVAKAVQEAA